MHVKFVPTNLQLMLQIHIGPESINIYRKIWKSSLKP